MISDTTDTSVTSVLLAAGRGMRMGSCTTDTPKSLLEVGGKPLIEYMLGFVRRINPRGKTIVVGGFCFDKLKAAVSSLRPDVLVVENPDFHLQNLTSFSKALPHITGGVFVCNTDYVFSNNVADAIARSLQKTVVFCSFDLGVEDDVMKVKVNPGTKGLYAMSKTLTDYDAIYTGAFYLEPRHVAMLPELIEQVFAATSPTDATVEYLFLELLKRGESIEVADVGRAEWYEVDTPEELARAQQAFEEGSPFPVAV